MHSFQEFLNGSEQAVTEEVSKETGHSSDNEKSLEPVYESLREPDLNSHPTVDLIELEPVMVIEPEETTGPGAYVPSLSRKLTKEEQKKYEMVKELHNVGHWGKQAMINLIKGGH